MRRLAWIPLLVLALAACSGGGDPGATETVTVTVTAEPGADPQAPPEDDGDEDDDEDDAAPDGGASVLVVDQPVQLGPDDEGDTALVTLHSVTYPSPGADQATGLDDTSALEDGNVLVQVEWRIENTGETDVYGVPVYPQFQTRAGEVRDAEWEIGLYGDYGSTGYEDEMPDSLSPGQFAQGWSIYEVPAEAGELIFPYGPDEVRVAVQPA